MSDVDGTLFCLAGDMEVSPNARRALTAWVAEPAAAAEPPSPVCWGSDWFCPADGDRMRSVEGQVSCPRCGGHLPPLLTYVLIEFHEHARITPAHE